MESRLCLLLLELILLFSLKVQNSAILKFWGAISSVLNAERHGAHHRTISAGTLI